MEINVGELRSRLTLTDSDELEPGIMRRLAEAAKELVLEELRREERRRAELLDSRRIDLERY